MDRDQHPARTGLHDPEDGHTPQLSDGAGGSRTPPDDIGGAIQFNIGRPPTLGSGQEQLVPFAFNIQALPFAAAGRYIVKLTLNLDPPPRFLRGTERD